MLCFPTSKPHFGRPRAAVGLRARRRPRAPGAAAHRRVELVHDAAAGGVLQICHLLNNEDKKLVL